MLEGQISGRDCVDVYRVDGKAARKEVFASGRSLVGGV